MAEFDFEHNSRMYNTYRVPSDSEMLKEKRLFTTFLCNFFYHYNINPNNVMVDLDILNEIIIRVDQRKLHYKMYHSKLGENGELKITSTNELKIAALYAYWIVKYKPITVKKEEKKGTIKWSADEINEKAALYLMLSTVRESSGNKLNVTEKKLGDLLYSIRHRMHSYDSFVAIIESLAENFEGDD